MVKVSIKGAFWQDIILYADTGASFSMLKASICDAIGLKLVKGKLVYVTVGDGGEIPVYLHRLPVKFCNCEFNATIGFSEKLGIGFNILGRKDFFDRFVFCFDDERKVLRVIEHEKSDKNK
ncbi:MAG: hypothetical protein QMD21_05920 [Candidatus Thermoplasmatota archaeon]|nr:hypothetical protein [Candidatus Thermoplasmatota archaeon]MDI6856301.1 hypothetical protein [Candidatus Thermoplasmatota archaeon]